MVLPAPGADELPHTLVEHCEDITCIHYDILGFAFWMLARIEELDSKERDVHDRFPGKMSNAFLNGYLDRPLVDEWLSFLGCVMEQRWPNVEFPNLEPSMMITCDIDSLVEREGGVTYVKRVIADLLKRHSLKLAQQTITNAIAYYRKDYKKNPNYCAILEMMDLNELQKQKVIFYFIAGGVHVNDASYSVKNPYVVDLIDSIISRGHEIGLHPSYMTYLDMGQIKDEIGVLNNVVKALSTTNVIRGSRQHFLRLKYPETLVFLGKLGVYEDASLGYADMPGFRAGTCHEYNVFDARQDKSLDIRVKPLIVMDTTLYSKRYLNLSDESVDCLISDFKMKCKKVNGCFSLLWHNTNIRIPSRVESYKKAIEPI